MTFWAKRSIRSPGQVTQTADLADYPLREYVASMAVELANLARSDGDVRLARALEGAAQLAREVEPRLA